MKLKLIVLFISLLVGGCAGKNGVNPLLPSSDTTGSAWATYAQAVANYEQIKVGMPEEKLREFGVYDGANNIEVWNFVGVYNALPEDAVKNRKFNEGVLFFLDAGNGRVKSFYINILVEHTVREGGFWADLFAFKRTTRTKGYKFKGLILLVDGLVTYVFPPTGGPVDRLVVERKPLGPLQNLGEDAPRFVGKAVF